jgi:hypothetical protein
MNQNRGRKRPRMNMIQWPFLIEMIPTVTNRTRYMRPSSPPVEVADAAKDTDVSPSVQIDFVHD